MFIMLFFVTFQACAAFSLLTIPTAIDTRVVSVLLALGWVWWITAFFAGAWVLWNAASLSLRAYRERHWRRLRSRNLWLAWTAPVVIVILMLTWQPVISVVADYRLAQDFENSRADFLVICDRVLAEGEDSKDISDDLELGVFSNVDVLYRDRVVFFEIGDNLRAYGYACVPEGETLPRRDDVNEYDKIDERFYNFSEIENRLTPQPETPTPDSTLELE
jgi:hypothetical protein